MAGVFEAPPERAAIIEAREAATAAMWREAEQLAWLYRMSLTHGWGPMSAEWQLRAAIVLEWAAGGAA